MKTVTPFLLRFALVATVLTIIFRFLLTYGINNNMTMVVILSAVLYGITMFISGWYFGKKDGNYLPIYDVGFRFHLTTYLIHNLISQLWFLLGFNSAYEGIGTVNSTALTWGLFLLLHLVFYVWTRRKTIDNLDKKDLFE